MEENIKKLRDLEKVCVGGLSAGIGLGLVALGIDNDLLASIAFSSGFGYASVGLGISQYRTYLENSKLINSKSINSKQDNTKYEGNNE